MAEGTKPQNMAKPVGSYIHVKKVSCKGTRFSSLDKCRWTKRATWSALIPRSKGLMRP